MQGWQTYANYMFGGGYIVSADVAKALVTMESMVKLKFTPIEDATVGFWLMGMDIRQIDHPKYAPLSIALSCPPTVCFSMPRKAFKTIPACSALLCQGISSTMCKEKEVW